MSSWCFPCFPLGLVTGINTVAPAMTFVTVSHGCWLTFGSCMHSFLSSSLWPSFLPLVISGVTGQEGSFLFVSYGWRRWLWCGV